jgi:hypothetical protein
MGDLEHDILEGRHGGFCKFVDRLAALRGWAFWAWQHLQEPIRSELPSSVTVLVAAS